MSTKSRSLFSLAGVLYLIIIVMGVGSEGAVRSTILVPGDTAATAANLLSNEGAFRLSILADVVMALADVGLGVVLLLLFWKVSKELAVAATAFRLAQAAVLGLNLSFLVAALPLAKGLSGVDGGDALATLALELHGVGYDLGLFFFAFNCFFTGALLSKVGAPRVIAAGLMASGGGWLNACGRGPPMVRRV